MRIEPFPLEKVLEFRRHVRLERRHALAAALADEQQLLDERTQVEAVREETLTQLGEVTRPGQFNVEAAARRRYFTGQLDVRLLILKDQIDKAHLVVEQRRNELIKADQDVQALERLREKHVEEQTYELRRKSELELADQWQASRR